MEFPNGKPVKTIFIDCEAREIMYLVVSVRLFVCPCSPMQLNRLTFDLDFWYGVCVCVCNQWMYRDMPNKGASHSLEEPNAVINGQNQHSFFKNCPIFNLKPPLES